MSVVTRQHSGPFLLYFAHNFPHTPLAVAPGRLGKSGAGLYGDVIEELDAGIGQLITALRDRQLLDNTLIIISSDNGPWFLGSAAGWRGRSLLRNGCSILSAIPESPAMSAHAIRRKLRACARRCCKSARRWLTIHEAGTPTRSAKTARDRSAHASWRRWPLTPLPPVRFNSQ